MTTLPGLSALVIKIAVSSTVRLEMQLKSGMAMAAPLIRILEVLNPSGLGGPPIVNRILNGPYGDVTAVAQCVVVVSSIRDFVKRLLYLVASALVEFVGHGLLGRAVWPES